jgi:hypothetical protein
VTWDGIPYLSAFPTILPDSYLQPSDLPTDSYQWTVQDFGITGVFPTSIFDIFDLTNGTITDMVSACAEGCTTQGINLDSGTLSFTLAAPAVPEPSSNVLIVTGIGLLGLLTQKRIAYGL